MRSKLGQGVEGRSEQGPGNGIRSLLSLFQKLPVRDGGMPLSHASETKDAVSQEMDVSKI